MGDRKSGRSSRARGEGARVDSTIMLNGTG